MKKNTMLYIAIVFAVVSIAIAPTAQGATYGSRLADEILAANSSSTTNSFTAEELVAVTATKAEIDAARAEAKDAKAEAIAAKSAVRIFKGEIWGIKGKPGIIPKIKGDISTLYARLENVPNKDEVNAKIEDKIVEYDKILVARNKVAAVANDKKINEKLAPISQDASIAFWLSTAALFLAMLMLAGAMGGAIYWKKKHR